MTSQWLNLSDAQRDRTVCMTTLCPNQADWVHLIRGQNGNSDNCQRFYHCDACKRKLEARAALMMQEHNHRHNKLLREGG